MVLSRNPSATFWDGQPQEKHPGCIRSVVHFIHSFTQPVLSASAVCLTHGCSVLGKLGLPERCGEW